MFWSKCVLVAEQHYIQSLLEEDITSTHIYPDFFSHGTALGNISMFRHGPHVSLNISGLILHELKQMFWEVVAAQKNIAKAYWTSTVLQNWAVFGPNFLPRMFFLIDSHYLSFSLSKVLYFGSFLWVSSPSTSVRISDICIKRYLRFIVLKSHSDHFLCSQWSLNYD